MRSLAAALAVGVLIGGAGASALERGNGATSWTQLVSQPFVPAQVEAATQSPASDTATIQQVIQQADNEQAQAIASGNPSVMQDTATSDYYQQLVQTNQDLVNNGVTAIQLSNIEWGPIAVNGSSATATSYETWATTTSDSSVETSRDTNNYTLVQDNGQWKIQSDVNPDAQNAQGGANPGGPSTGQGMPGVPGQTAPGMPGSGPQASTAPSTVPGQPSIPGFPYPFVTTPGTSPSSPLPRQPGRSQNPAPGQTAPTSPRPTSPVPNRGTSHNWSGYAATSGNYTGVTATWTVPSVGSGDPGVGASWVGIGGVNSRDLIQAGTEDDSAGSGHAQYHAWIETLPQASHNIQLAVRPGDSVTVSINEQSPGMWQVSFKNNTTGQNYQTNVQYNSSHSSAEWVEEAPSGMGQGVMPLDSFGTINFSNAQAVQNGQTVNMSQAGAQPITMLGSSGQQLAVPSSIGSDGASFSVSRTDAPATTTPTGRGGSGRTSPSYPGRPSTAYPGGSGYPGGGYPGGSQTDPGYPVFPF
jgi:hypothetical protein